MKFVELKTVQPEEAVSRLEKRFKAEAYRLRPLDWAMQEDLAQEMALAVLQCLEPQPLLHFKELARKQAIEYLRKWDEASKVPKEFNLAQRIDEVDLPEHELLEARDSETSRKAKVDSLLGQRISRSHAA
jgi:hypothetical protein